MITTSAHRSHLPLITLVFLIMISLIAPSLVGAQDPGKKETVPATNPPTAPAPAAPAPAAAAPPPGKGSAQLVSIDFNNVDIGVFIKFISDLTNRNFIIDDKVRGKVTIISPGKITVDEAYKVFESVLEVYGFATVKSGEITKIVPAPDARTKNIKTRLEEESGVTGDVVVTQIIPLRYADPEEIKNLFTPLISKNSIIQAYDPTNTLIVTDVQSNIQRLIRILKTIDVTGVGQQIAIIPLENASASKLTTLLQVIFQGPKGGKVGRGGGSNATFVADERTNIIVVMASEGDIDNIRQLVKSLDISTPKGQGNINVYYLEHATAEDVAKVLMDIPQKGADGKTQEGKPQAPVVSNKVRVAADKATNSLIITADTEEYLVLESIIKKLDIPRSMVYIEALIMEVNVAKNFQLGVQWQVGSQTSYDGKDMVYGGGFQPESSLYKTPAQQLTSAITSSSTSSTSSGSIPNVPQLNSGFSMGIFGEMIKVGDLQFPTIAAVVNAYKKDTDVRILSTPQILTTDNQEAKIYVGKNVPFQTSVSASSTMVGNVYNSYEYKDVGKTLKITPQISKDRLVRLTISLEVTAIEGTQTAQPTTLKRTIDTTAIVQDGNTVVLGGLIGDQEDSSNYKVPCLGDIPGFGNLFRSTASSTDKSNLYIFLMPRVIQGPAEASNVSSKKRDEIESATEKNIKLYHRKNETPRVKDLQMPAPKPDASIPAGVTTGASISSAQSAPSAGASAEAQKSNAQEATAALQEPGINEETSESSGAVQGYTVQVASVKLADKANEILAELTAKGFAAYLVRTDVNGTIWYRVRIGYFTDKGAADPVMDQLKAGQYSPMLIKL